jgi:hypothetical protein
MKRGRSRGHAAKDHSSRRLARAKCPCYFELCLTMHSPEKPVREGRLSEEELAGLGEDKLKSICSHAKFLARLEAVA